MLRAALTAAYRCVISAVASWRGGQGENVRVGCHRSRFIKLTARPALKVHPMAERPRTALLEANGRAARRGRSARQVGDPCGKANWL